MDVQGSIEAGFEPNALRDCLGVPPLPAAGQ
jgi:hypothetical protein